MLRSLLTISLTFLLLNSYAQDTIGHGKIKSIIKQYESTLQLTGDTNTSPKDLSASAKLLLQDYESPRIYVYNDLDSVDSDTNYTILGSYMKQLSDYEWGYTTGINHPKVRITGFQLNKSRNCYSATADVLKFTHIPIVTTALIDTFRIDTSLVDEQTSYDTVKYVFTKRDTTITKKISKLTFHFSSIKKDERGNYEDIKVVAIAKFGSEPKLRPLDPLFEYWVNLPDGWKKAFNEELQLGEVPSKYRLGFISGIEKVNLKDKGITTLEPLKGTTSLRKLDCTDLPIKDLSPIQNLINLEELIITGTKVDTLLYLEKLTKLQKLSARDLDIHDISYLKNMTEMIELDLAENQIDTVVALYNMTKLEKLDLSLNHITDISFIKNLTSVTELHIRKNEIKTLEPLRGFYNLVILDCFNTDITTLEPLAGLKKLTYLDCSHTKITSLSPIKNNYYLTTLYCNNTLADNFGIISDFKYLRDLNVSTTAINSIDPVMQLEYITTFKAIDTKIGKDAIQRFKKKHPKCKIWYY